MQIPIIIRRIYIVSLICIVLIRSYKVIKMICQQNSQDEQGFIATKLIAKVSDLQDIRDSKGKECKMFNAFYLPSGQGNMKLEIPESLQPIDQFGFEEQNMQNDSNHQIKAKSRPIDRNLSNYQKIQHPYRVYGESPLFQLVYSRNCSQQPIYNQFQYIKNDVILQTSQILKQQQSRFWKSENKQQIRNSLRNPYSRSLRPFQYSSITPMGRNSSIRSNDSIPYSSELLVFDSRFQSGNLYCAYHKSKSNQYHLFIENDTNSYGYNQWFYFSLANIIRNVEYKLVIVNFKKKNSFFRSGFKPIVYSLKRYQKNNKNGWYRSGLNVEYSDSNITTSKFFKFYKLTFTLKFQHDHDYALVAANLPYSYSRLSNYLQMFSKQFKQSSEKEDQIADMRISTLGRTFCGNTVPQVRIIPKVLEQKKVKSPTKSKNKITSKKKMIVFLARQHPGETVSSFLMQKILDNFSKFGTQSKDDIEAQNKQNIKVLLKNYTILIFPMVNIDGVIYGNSRCDASGMDLNRRWKNPSKIFHPQIHNIKSRLQNYSKKYDIVGCFDLHGHSKLYNVFCYSCKIHPVTCRILPYLISKQTDKFYFPSCTFGITRQKSTTARATIFKTIKNQNVLTIQMSYFGYIQRKQSDQQKGTLLFKPAKSSNNDKKVANYFQPKTFNEIAQAILNGLSIFLDRQSSNKYKNIENQIKENLTQILSYQKLNQQGKEDSGSESDPEGDQIDFEVKINTIFGKQFSEQARFFRPAQQENIQIEGLLHTQSIQFGQRDSPIHSKMSSRQSLLSHSKQKNQNVAKIRISKPKNNPSNRKTLTNQKFQSQLKFFNNEQEKKLPKKKDQKKQTVSFSLQRNYKLVEPEQKIRQKRLSQSHKNTTSEQLYSQNAQRLMFGSKKHSQMLIRDESFQQTQISQAPSPKIYDDLIIYSAQSKQVLNYQKSNLLQRPYVFPQPLPNDNQFFIKFQKFLPSHPLPPYNKKQKLSFLEESIYKDDQREILNTLLENKKRLEKEKLKRDIEKSTTIAERYQYKNGMRTANGMKREQELKERMVGGIFGSNGKKKEDIVDFRKFKDRDKLKIQLKQANQSYSKYLTKEGYY